MASPLHTAAFQRFMNATPNHLEAMIAFGLFMDSEHKWASLETAPPTDRKYREYHAIYLTPHEIEGYIKKARLLLQHFGTNLIENERVQFLSQALDQCREATAEGERRFRFWGVVEAILGALGWTVILIVFAIILARSGIDIFEYYQRAKGVH